MKEKPPPPEVSLHAPERRMYCVGANPPPAWSKHIGPKRDSSPIVATQLVIPTELSEVPVNLTCVYCQCHVATRVHTYPSGYTWCLCLCMCFFLMWPCCLLPFCCSSLFVTKHRCSNCGRVLGTYNAWTGRAD